MTVLNEDIIREVATIKERQTVLVEEMRDLKGEMKGLRLDLRGVIDKMNNQRGFVAGMLFLASGAIWLIMWGIEKVIK